MIENRFKGLGTIFIFLAFMAAPMQAQDSPSTSVKFQAGDMLICVSNFGRVMSEWNDQGDIGAFWPVDSARTTTLTQWGPYLPKHLVNTAAPVLAGYVRGELRVSGSYYRDYYLPGPIYPGMKSGDPASPRHRAYTITRGSTKTPDYIEWPSEFGAPVDDAGGPYFYGPTQMFWVMNDLDTTSMQKYMLSDPMGLELQCLMHSLDAPEHISRDVTMLRLQYVNRSSDTIRDAWTGLFADIDLRSPSHNASFSDSLRSLIGIFNNNKNVREDGLPAAFGICMVQGPTVPAKKNDKARWSSGWKYGYRNFPAEAAIVPVKNHRNHPAIEPLAGLDSAKSWYALLKGAARGTSVRNPNTGRPQRFWFDGDPVSQRGWLIEDGFLFDDGTTRPFRMEDQRVMISSGPFDLAPGDTQQVVYAFITARGANSSTAIQSLRDKAEFVRAHHNDHKGTRALRSTGVETVDDLSASTLIFHAESAAGEALVLEGIISDERGNLISRIPLNSEETPEGFRYSGQKRMKARRKGVNTSILLIDGSDTVKVPCRVSVPIGGTLEIGESVVLREVDNNGRVAPDEDARWFPLLKNKRSFDMSLHVQTDDYPYPQWMFVPSFPAGATVPSSENPWQPHYNARSVQYDEVSTWGREVDSVFDDYHGYDVWNNNWWQGRSGVAVDSTTGEMFDALMTRVRGASNERPGVRILNPAQLQNRWYVASIRSDSVIRSEYTDSTGAVYHRTWYHTRVLALHDSATGAPLGIEYDLNNFDGKNHAIDGFQIVNGTNTSDRLWYEIIRSVSDSVTIGTGICGENVYSFDERVHYKVVFGGSQKYWNVVDGRISGETLLPMTTFMRTQDKEEWISCKAAVNVEFDDLLFFPWTEYSTNIPDSSDVFRPCTNSPAQLRLWLPSIPESGQIELYCHKPITPSDLFIFNPRHVLLARSNKPATTASVPQIWPIPFSTAVSIVLEITAEAMVRAEVFDMLGRQVKILTESILTKGRHALIWDGYRADGSPAENGTYIIRVITGSEVQTNKILLVR